MFKVYENGSIKESQTEPSKSSFVKIGGVYYDRASSAITKVNGRFYRINSPLIVFDYRGEFILKKEAFEFKSQTRKGTSVTMYCHNSEKKVETNEGSFPEIACIKIKGEYYPLNSKQITRTYGGEMHLISDCEKLDEQLYGSEAYAPKSYCEIDELSSKFVLKSDIKRALSNSNGLVNTHKSRVVGSVYLLSGIKLTGVKDFLNDITKQKPVFITGAVSISKSFLDFKGRTFYGIKSEEAEMDKIIKEAKKEIMKEKIKLIKDSCQYEAIDEEENTAEIIDFDYGRMPGGRVFGDYRKVDTDTENFSLTGGISFSFGVEIETSHGKVPAEQLKSANLALIGDGSIGAGEYVTGVLAGDSGMNSLSRAMEVVRENCYIDNRCSTHVHIGAGVDASFPANKSYSEKTLEFLGALVKLGTLIEDELFSMCSPARHPSKKYCQSIKKYAGINSNNLVSYLCDFAHGNQYSGGIKEAIKRELNRWTSSRYKWLNLVHMLSASRQSTVEFRIWDATMSYKKSRYYTLISMAITKFALANSKEILSTSGYSVLLADIMRSCLDSQTASEVNSWIELRKEKFAPLRNKVSQEKVSQENVSF